MTQENLILTIFGQTSQVQNTQSALFDATAQKIATCFIEGPYQDLSYVEKMSSQMVVLAGKRFWKEFLDSDTFRYIPHMPPDDLSVLEFNFLHGLRMMTKDYHALIGGVSLPLPPAMGG